MPERDQRLRGDTVARRHGFVGKRFRLVNQLLVVVGREEKTAARILEMRQEHVDELTRELQIGVAPAILEQLHESVREEGVVIEIRRQARTAVLTCRLQASVAPE